jgi:hypothetical protein
MDEPLSLTCGCGSVGFVATFPHPDEEQLALKIYSRDIEEKNLYAKIAEEEVASLTQGAFDASPQDKNLALMARRRFG